MFENIQSTLKFWNMDSSFNPFEGKGGPNFNQVCSFYCMIISPSQFFKIPKLTIKYLSYPCQTLFPSKTFLYRYSQAFISNEMQIMGLYHFPIGNSVQP